MDERLWWIATKLQETFGSGGPEGNPAELEDFVRNERTYSMISQFLAARGPLRLFFYCNKSEDGNDVNGKNVYAVDSLAAIRNTKLEDLCILYMFRTNQETEVDASCIEKEIICGELKGNVIGNMTNILTEVYVSLLKAKSQWGKCSRDGQTSLFHSLDKAVNGLSEAGVGSHHSRQAMLRQPSSAMSADLKMQRLAAQDQEAIAEYEELVTSWIYTIEAVLTENTNDRFIEPNSGPLMELERWHRQQRLLTNIAEQLKSKDCKAVISVLITCKSRLLKKWKIVDASITDYLNEVKDKVRYLESLRKYFELLYFDATPSVISSQAIPGIMQTIKQMESASRFYVRQGYMGLLFTTITNQMVQACKDYVLQYTTSADVSQTDILWQQLQREIANYNPSSASSEFLQQKYLNAQLVNKLKTPSSKPDTREGSVPDDSRADLMARLRACLAVQSAWREAIKSLRESLGVAHNLSHGTSQSSLTSSSGRPTKLSQPRASGASVSVLQSSSKKAVTSSSHGERQGCGIGVNDEDIIMTHMDTLCARVRSLVYIISTMGQYERIVVTTHGLPQPRVDDLANEELEPEKPQPKQKEPDEGEATESGLGAIIEDDEKQMNEQQQQDEDAKADENIFEMRTFHSGLRQTDIDILRKFLKPDNQDSAINLSAIIEEQVHAITASLKESLTAANLLDTTEKEQEKFRELYQMFEALVLDCDSLLGAYLRAVFIKKLKTPDAIAILDKFSFVQQRQGLKKVLAEKTVDAFGWFENNLQDIQSEYEAGKNDPPRIWNAPPVAGAISWSRQLLRRIEEPMKFFRENKTITQLKDYGRIVKVYNKLATTFVTFESLYFVHWKNSLSDIKAGLRATLLVQHPETKQLVVNADEKVLELIQEARWMTRMDVQLPDVASKVLAQEGRFKSYKNNLELYLREFQSVQQTIPPILRDLFQSHVEATRQIFQPGLNTLSWDSMNIDAFLHQVSTGIGRLRDTVAKAYDIIRNRVEATLEKIHAYLLFDSDLAFSKAWDPSEFENVIGQSVSDRTRTLCDMVAAIQAHFAECAALLVGKKSRGSERSTVSASTKQHELLALLSDKYSEALYEAILMCVMRTIVTLAESSGCSSEAIKAASLLSDVSSNLKLSARSASGLSSRSASVMSLSNLSHPISLLTILNNTKWTDAEPHDVTYLQFKVNVKLAIPDIVVEPALSEVQKAMATITNLIMDVPKGISWDSDSNLPIMFVQRLHDDQVLNEIRCQVDHLIESLETGMKHHLVHVAQYSFLWKDDMRGHHEEFMRGGPSLVVVSREVERLLKIEKNVLAIPTTLGVGAICLHMQWVKDALHGFAMAWKNLYASVLHDEAKSKLTAAVTYRNSVIRELDMEVNDLDHLNRTLHLLAEVQDMENKIDTVYLPIETMYTKLRDYELLLPRSEVDEVTQLRTKWLQLLVQADHVRNRLLKEKKTNFEQDLDKQVKGFVVEVIQFRNAFDAQGPAVPGIPPMEAVQRLDEFQQLYVTYDAKRNTLNSVSKLFGIAPKKFPELDRTSEELELLNLLYGLYQKFLQFEATFRDTLWAEVDLESAIKEVESYWDECLALPSKLTDWESYLEMKKSMQSYRDMFPLLQRLCSKEIRNRHWLNVMAITHSNFMLEANVFRLHHLLDIDLLKHKREIEEICLGAKRELELETRLRITEEEWTEQVLNFENYHKRGPVLLEKSSTERTLEQLEDAQAMLAQMLTSRYIGPLREEAASWAEKLREVGDVLETWLDVQDLWSRLEVIFGNTDVHKELSQEEKRFVRVDKTWMKTMKKAFDTKNVLQCCCGDEVPKSIFLRHIQQELEICFKSLVNYLDSKRRVFPRFFFVSDPILLAILSRPNDLESVRPHLRSLFAAISDIKLQRRVSDEEENDGRSSRHSSAAGQGADRTGVLHHSSHSLLAQSSVTKVDKRLTVLQGNMPMISANYSSLLPSETQEEEIVLMDATAVCSAEGETVVLSKSVPLDRGVEQWLCALQVSVADTISNLLVQVAQDINNSLPCEDWALKYPAQVCCMGLLYLWSRECQQAVIDLRLDRKALQAASRRFMAYTSRLPTLLNKGNWKLVDASMLPALRTRAENMITYSTFLRDLIDVVAQRKIREPGDFEWKRSMRFSIQTIDGKPVPTLSVLDDNFVYGCEFLGAQPVMALTQLTDRCMLAVTQTLALHKATLLTGQASSGRTETIRSLSQTLGRFLLSVQCTNNLDAAALSRIMQGLVLDGCWGMLCDLHSLSQLAVATVLTQLQGVISAMNTGKLVCNIGENQVSIHKHMALFATCQPDLLTSSTLPCEIKSLFRQVSFLRPDLLVMLKAKCLTLQFKAPSLLALRLKIVADLMKDQVPDQSSFSVSALTSVLLHVMQRRRTVREDKSQERVDNRTTGAAGGDASRSDSQLSVSLRQDPAPVATTSLTGGKEKAKKSTVTSTLSPIVKHEHALVGQALLEIIGSRLNLESLAIFRQVVKDVFSSLPEAAKSSNTSTRLLEAAIESVSQEAGLANQKTWSDKCLQLVDMAAINSGLIVAGAAGSGKSSLIQTVVSALSTAQRPATRRAGGAASTGGTKTTHKILRIMPFVTENLPLIFGYVNDYKEWVDGIFTSALKKATRNQCTTWLCLDGPLSAGCFDMFAMALERSQVFQLANGDQLAMTGNVKIVFETDDLASVTPSLITRTGIVHVDKNTVGWRPVAKAWIEKNQSRGISSLQRVFNNTVDAVNLFIQNECKPKLRQSEMGMFQTCLSLLTAMVSENMQVSGELHIERIYLFCLMWAYGSFLNDKDRKAFNELLKTLSTALPDDDRDISFFDYYVDESGEWDSWLSRVPETDSNINGNIVIETVDAVRTKLFLHLAAQTGKNLLLCGPAGSGKTSIINDFLYSQDVQSILTKRLVFSGATSSKQLQQTIESNITRRQGFTYGASDNRLLQLFIEDINLSKQVTKGVASSHELLRSLVDARVLYTLEKPFEWRSIEALSVIGTMLLSDYTTISAKPVSQRLLRHFMVFFMPQCTDKALEKTVSGILEANMSENNHIALDADLASGIVRASCQLVAAVSTALRPSPLPGRRHYCFSLKDIATCFQSLKKLPDESRAESKLVVSLWKHEMERIIRDQIVRHVDQKWFDDTISEILHETWPQLEEPLSRYFVTFATDPRHAQRSVTNATKKEKGVLMPVEDLQSVHACLQVYLNHHNEEFGNVHLDIMLSENIICHIIKIHRVLSMQNNGNMLLIGPVGSHLTTLCKLALHVADIPSHTIDTSRHTLFLDSLRAALRMTGAEGKKLALVFNNRHFNEDMYLDAVNSLLLSSQYPHLFSSDEMEGLLQALGPVIKRQHPGVVIDPLKFFEARVRTNLHMIMCLSPNHWILRSTLCEFPGLLSGCQTMWMCDWSKEALLAEAACYITKHGLTTDCDTDLSESIMACMANIHSFVLMDCRQMKEFGDSSEEVAMSQSRGQKKDQADKAPASLAALPNKPYSRSILLENIRLRHRKEDEPTASEVYIGPTTYRRFMETFHRIYASKSSERFEKVEKLKKALGSLDTIKADLVSMKETIQVTEDKYAVAENKTAELLDALTAKATILEKLKAKLGLAAPLNAFLQQLNEMTGDEDEENVLLQGEERDEYDAEFEKMREMTLKNRQVQSREELEETKLKIEDCQKKLKNQREQVLFWKNRVDRNSIDRIRSSQNPTIVVGLAMEMIMVLIGKKSPSDRIEKREYPLREEHSGIFSASSGSTKTGQPKKPKGVKESSGDRYDRQAWKAMMLSVNDPGKLVEMLHNIKWESGLKPDVTQAIESYLAKSKNGQLGVTGEGTMLENAAEREKQFVPQRASFTDDNKGITIAAAKYASEDIATLVQYAIAIVEYTRLCEPLQAALNKQTELMREIAEIERINHEKELLASAPQEEVVADPVDVMSEADLEPLQEEVDGLQAVFDASAIEKHSLEVELVSLRERLKASSDVVESLKHQEADWRMYIEHYSSNDVLVANCLSAAAFLTYCTPFNTDTRKRMGEFFLNVCEHHKIPLPDVRLFSSMPLVSFLCTPLNVCELELCGLPQSPLMLENAAVLMQEESMQTWPLFCDPTGRARRWLHEFLQKRKIVEVKYSELKSQFDTCLADGSSILITDVSVDHLLNDERFRHVLLSRNKFVAGHSRFKISVGNHDVECDPAFRMYLHTSSQPHHIPAEIAAYIGLILFQQTRADTEADFLDVFMQREKGRLCTEKKALLQEKSDNLRQFFNLEEQTVVVLSSEQRLIDDLAATRKLMELRKQYEETEESQYRIVGAEKAIVQSSESYSPIAKRAAVCYMVACHMYVINPLYITSYDQFLDIYDVAIAHSDRAALKTVIDRLTQSAFASVYRLLMDKDKLIYALTLALEVEDSLGHVGVGEREFLIAPSLGSVTMTALGRTGPSDSKLAQSKKQFDWMTDDQFNNLQILAIHYDWFQDMFDRMHRDGRETQWRSLCENEQPELQPLPDKMDDKFTPLQRLLVVRAVRSDRLIQASNILINAVLGKKMLSDQLLDLSALLKQSAPHVPILVLYNGEQEVVERLVSDLAQSRQVDTVHMTLTGHTSGEDKAARALVQRAIAQGQWAVLQNGQHVASMLAALENVVSEPGTDGLTQLKEPFRCWIMAQATSHVPLNLLQHALKIVIDAPKTVRDTVVRALATVDPELIKLSSRSDWLPTVHNLCYLHAALRLRARYGRSGWNVPTDFAQLTNRELMESLNMSLNEFKDPTIVSLSTSATEAASPTQRIISWSGLRSLLTEVIYGSQVTDTQDQQCLAALVDFWIAQTSTRKDFEISRVKYRIPAAFFASSPRMSQLSQAIESLPQYMLDVPDVCCLNSTVETILGDDQYVFTRLNKIFDSMPASESLSHSLFPRAPTPSEGPPLSTISLTSNSPQIVSLGVFASGSYAALRMRKEVDLLEICTSSLSKLPKIISKDNLNEKIKKIGGLTSFNMYLLKEIDIMNSILLEMRSCLQAIKEACELSSLGDILTSDQLDCADDLYHLRIPRQWSAMSRSTLPPPNQALGSWLADLSNRYQHFDRMLSMGREKMPAYWLGAFFYPRGLLALLRQDSYRHYAQEHGGQLEQFVFQTEITARDKDHIRDPPPEGMFVFGIYLWGCAWDKATGELQDTPPKGTASQPAGQMSCTALPVVHLTCWPQSEKPLLQDSQRATEVYSCPVYQSRIAPRDTIFELDLWHTGIPASKWALRSLSATVRQY